MDYFLQQVVNGLVVGFVYAGLALALVLVYQGTGVLNFAQGAMATFSAFLTWSLVQVHLSWPLAAAAAIVASFLIGLVLERIFVRPVENAPELSLVIVTIALFLAVNAITGWIWGYLPHSLGSPFGGGVRRLAGAIVTDTQLGMAVTLLVVVLAVHAFLRWTPLGLTMRAAAQHPVSSRLLGIRVGLVLALGWGLAAVVGAVVAMLAAPIVGLDTNVFLSVLLYSFAAAALGGFGSVPGALLGGLFVGLSETLVGAYVPAIGSDLQIVVPFGLIILVMLLRPSGLLGRRSALRV